MAKPVVIYSRLDIRHTGGFLEHGDLVDTVRLDTVTSCDWSVAYMRVCHFLDEDLVSAARVEARLRAGGARIVNSVDNRITCQRKDLYYARLAAHGVNVPFHVANPTLHEIRLCLYMRQLEWPFIYRSVDGSGGRDIHLVHDEAEYGRAVEAVAAAGRRGMAARFVNSGGSGSRHVKRRVYVVFGAVDMHLSDVRDHWNVQRGGKTVIADYLAENRPRETPELDRMSVEVGRILGLDVFSLDAVQDSSTGEYFIVDVNPTYVARPAPILLPADGRKFFESHFRRVALKLKEISDGHRM